MLGFRLRRSCGMDFFELFRIIWLDTFSRRRLYFQVISPENTAIPPARWYLVLLIPVFLVVFFPFKTYSENALSLSLSATNVTCNGQNNGSIVSTVSGGSGGTVNYTLTPGTISNTTGLFTNLSAGIYSVSANDAGMVATASATITEPPVSANPSISVGSVPTLCPGTLSFALNFAIVGGSPVSYSIVAGTPSLPGFIPITDGSLGTSPLMISLPAAIPKGTFQFLISVKNASGCISSSQSFSLIFDDVTKPLFNVPNAITVFTDLSCKVNITPAVTGDVVIRSDNCTPFSGLVVTHTDGTPVPLGGSCSIPYTVTRTWRVSDASGNFDEKTQLITVNDNIKPILTIPSDVSLSCEQSILPAVTGIATATDNCGVATTSYADTQVNGSCTGNRTITRVWTAVDCSGNSSSGSQRIIVADNSKPVATIPNISVGCPADIPSPYPDLIAFFVNGGTAVDNCGTLNLTLVNEISNGLNGKPGYCPTSVTRVYRLTDACGNYTDVVQTISILSECGCSKCTPGTNFHLIDLLGKPTGSVAITNQQRNGACCVESNCISFNVRLDNDAIGVEILIDGATPSPQDWRIDCNNVSINGNVICLPGGSFHLFTFCKPGANKNDYTFRSVPGVIGSGNITTRVECNSQVSATGITSNPVWNSISPGIKGQYNHYLSSTTVANPFFTADINSPPVIQYEVCGNIGTTICNALGTDCATATVYIKQKIELVWNTDPANVCIGNMPTLSANISPAGNYNYDWYNGHGATGILIQSGTSTYKPSLAGPYSVRVTDVQSGVSCNSAIFDFDVTLDNNGPTVLAPPQPLVVMSSDPTATQQIANWLATATASYQKPDGTIVTLVPSNDYTGINLQCNSVLNVKFSAFDQCGNVTLATSTITISDNIKPIISCPGNTTQLALSGNCSLANVIVPDPAASDNCAIVLQKWTMSGATSGSSPATGINSVSGQTFNVGLTTVTYTVADATGNSVTCSFDVWIKDLVKPVFASGCPADMTIPAIAGQCSALVSIPVPTISDPCNEGYTITNSYNNTSNASGTYPVGVTAVAWTITDVSGNNTICNQKITVTDQFPVLTCTPNMTIMADFEKLFASNVTVPPPSFSDDCPGYFLTWNLTGATTNSSAASGVNILPANYTFNLGITTLQYVLTDANGHSVTCSMTVTVLSKPDIDCQPDINKNTDPGLCSASLNPGFPLKLSGGEPITYSWTISGATPSTGTSTGVGAIVPNPYLFNAGITTISWKATNIAGSDQCSQVITITDKEPPTLIVPGPFEFCVENLISAAMISSLLQLNPAPDHFLFKKGVTLLDVNPASFADNCTPANQMVLQWKIDFSAAIPSPSISGSGQPSLYSSDIIFPGDGNTFQDVTHTITYWVTDLSGNESVHKSVAITIHPRPAVTFLKRFDSLKNYFISQI